MQLNDTFVTMVYSSIGNDAWKNKPFMTSNNIV